MGAKTAMIGRIVFLTVLLAIISIWVPYKIKLEKQANLYFAPFVRTSEQLTGTLSGFLEKDSTELEPELSEIGEDMDDFIGAALDLEKAYPSKIPGFERFQSAVNHAQNRFFAIHEAYQQGKQLYPSEYTFLHHINDGLSDLLDHIRNEDGSFRREIYNKRYFSQQMLIFADNIT